MVILRSKATKDLVSRMRWHRMTRSFATLRMTCIGAAPQNDPQGAFLLTPARFCRIMPLTAYKRSSGSPWAESGFDPDPLT